MRPNYAQDPPPETIEIDGCAYPVDTDYRTWIDALRMLERVGEEGVLAAVEKLLFGGVLADEDPQHVAEAICRFAEGYPHAPCGDGGGGQGWSFEYDLNEIIIAIRNQSGIDLSYRRREPFHWWEFLLELRTLCGEHCVLNLMRIRSYEGRDARLLALKNRYARPAEPDPAQAQALEEINREFYGA